MDNKHSRQTLLIELDQECRQEHYDKAAEWFKNVQLTQASFRQLLKDTVSKIEELHIKDYIFSFKFFYLIKNDVHLCMLNRMINIFQSLFFIPLENQDFSEYEPLITYLGFLFLSFIWLLYF